MRLFFLLLVSALAFGQPCITWEGFHQETSFWSSSSPVSNFIPLVEFLPNWEISFDNGITWDSIQNRPFENILDSILESEDLPFKVRHYWDECELTDLSIVQNSGVIVEEGVEFPNQFTTISSFRFSPNGPNSYTFSLLLADQEGQTLIEGEMALWVKELFDLTVILENGSSGFPASSQIIPEGDLVGYSYTSDQCFDSVAVELNGFGAPASGEFEMQSDNTIQTISGEQSPIFIPDATFKSYLVNNYDQNGDGEICPSEALYVHGIPDEGPFDNMIGIEYFTNIEFIRVFGVSFVPDISGLNKLYELKLFNSPVTQLVGLPTSLRTLFLESTLLYEIPGLPGLANLEYFRSNGSNFSNFPALESLGDLIEIFITDSSISSVPDLSTLVNLETLILGESPITFISDLSNLLKLKTLTLEQIQTPSTPKMPINLEQLSLSGNSFVELGDLSGLINLVNLYVNQTQVISLPLMPTSLQVLSVSNNPISSLGNVGELINLILLSISNNQITVIPEIQNLTQLHSIYAERNLLTSLPELGTLTNLRYLKVRENRLTTTPDLTNLSEIRALDFVFNQLTEVPNIYSIALNHEVCPSIGLSYNYLTTEDCAGIHQILRWYGSYHCQMVSFNYWEQNDGHGISCYNNPTIESLSITPNPVAAGNTSLVEFQLNDIDADDITWEVSLSNGNGGYFDTYSGGPNPAGETVQLIFHSLNPTIALVTLNVSDDFNGDATTSFQIEVQ